MKKILEFVDVSIAVGERILFKNISFTLYEGERLMLLGKNGAGKSLLLSLVARGYNHMLKEKFKQGGGLNVTGKIINQNGIDILNDEDEGYKPVYVTQNEEFHFNSTVLDEAHSCCNAMGIELDERKLDALLDRFNLRTKKKQKVENGLSFGEGKIIHLVTKILQLEKSGILLLDEPLNHLSFESSKIFNDLINEEIEKNLNLTIIMISHCKAANFIKETLSYDYNEHKMVKKPFTPYDCFE